MSCRGVIMGMPVKEKRTIGQIILQLACTRTLIDNPRTEGKEKKTEIHQEKFNIHIRRGRYNSYTHRNSKNHHYENPNT